MKHASTPPRNSTLPKPRLGTRLEQVLEAAPNGVVVVDAQGTIALVNPELERMFGYAPGSLLGQSVDMLLPERLRDMHQSQRGVYFRDPERRPMGVGRELFGRRADGTEFPLEIGLNTIDSPAGKLVVAAVVDISTRKEAEAIFSKVVEASPYGMVMIDEQGKIALVNSHTERLFGYRRDELVGMSIERLVPARHRTKHVGDRKDYHRAPSLRAMGGNRDLTGQHKDGTEFPVEIGLSPLRIGNQSMVLAAVIDITVRKHLELELREANAHLEEFTYVASHDLKSPLRGISDLVEWLIEDLQEHPSDEVRKNLERIGIRVARMERIIEDLLAYARARNVVTTFVTIEPRELVQSVLETETVPPGFEVSVEISASPFKATRTPLETVLRNLVGNAIKHHDRDHGRIAIHAHEDDSYCHFQVSDDGPGIPENAQERAFKLFQTVSASERKGSGIGLALSKRLVESHGGKIELRSKNGERGSTFHVRWPRFQRRTDPP